MKKIFLVFILIFSLSFFYGCEKREVEIKEDYIMLSLATSSSGAAVQSFNFSCNSSAIRQMSTSLSEELKFRQNLLKIVNNIRNEFLFSFALTYISNPIEDYKIGSGVVLSMPLYSQQNDTIGFDIVFTSQDSWNYYHGTKGGQSADKKFFLYKKQVSSGAFPFSAKNAEGQLVAQTYINRYLSAASGLSFEEKLKENYHPQFIYNYSTPSSKLHSDAPLNFKGKEGYYHHVWAEEDITGDERINLSVIIINKACWLLLAITIPLSACLISLVVIKIKQKSSRIKTK